MIFIVSILFLMTSVFAVVSNRDIFTPGKLYLVFFLAFHVGALFTPTTIQTGVFVLMVLGMGIFMVLQEAGTGTRPQILRPAKPAERKSRPNIDHTTILWVASIPPVLAQLYMIQHFGGLEGYVQSISLRVVEWAGFGWARTLIGLIVPVNVVYFAIGCHQRRPGPWWILYAAHFALVFVIALLSGSRSSLLNIFIFQLIIYHYMVRRVQMHAALVLGMALILSATTLGVLRNVVRLQDGDFTTIESQSSGSTAVASFSYGIEPLEIITTTEYPQLAYGSTFLSIFTNAVPRDIWPDKPASGGVFFTKNYVGDIWLGYSNLTPTFLGEWIINFGPALGVIGFFLSYGWIALGLERGYRRITAKIAQAPSDVVAIDLVIYLSILVSMVGLIVSETTNVVLLLLTTQLIPLWLLRLFISWRTTR